MKDAGAFTTVQIPRQAVATGMAAGPDGGHPHAPAGRKRRWSNPLAAVPLGTKLVTCMLVLLVVGTMGVSVAICQMADNYLLQKTDSQLIRQARLGITNATLLNNDDQDKTAGTGPTDYFLQIRDEKMNVIVNELNTSGANGVISMPRLPANGTLGQVALGKPFTTPAVVKVDAKTTPDSEAMQAAQAPWRVVAMNWTLRNKLNGEEIRGVLFIGLSMSDQIETVHALTSFCLVICVIVVILGGVISALLIQSTLAPLKRIEKTAAKIAAGDLSQRVPSLPENTEVGSLAASLNVMLARIEKSFDEQKQTTEKMKQFVSDASHELRTPLAAIHGYAELYRMQRDYPGALERADESIQHIEDSSARMSDLVADLLSLARLDEGRGITTTLPVDLTGVVRDSADDLHALDMDRKITCGSLQVDAGLPDDGDPGHPALGAVSTLTLEEGPLPEIQVVGDPSRLRQVATNIVGNIHRYTPADSPVQIGMGLVQAAIPPDILATLPSTDASLARFMEAVQVSQNSKVGDGYVVMQFVDHGPGASAAARSRLFERFYTADPSRARQKGGTGLGLAIVQSIIKAHHGLICATETPGGGLTFTVVIPQGSPDEAARAAKEAKASEMAKVKVAKARTAKTKEVRGSHMVREDGLPGGGEGERTGPDEAGAAGGSAEGQVPGV